MLIPLFMLNLYNPSLLNENMAKRGPRPVIIEDICKYKVYNVPDVYPMTLELYNQWIPLKAQARITIQDFEDLAWYVHYFRGMNKATAERARKSLCG